MNTELKTKWLAALRSGEYTQTSGSLRDNDGHCCLGVLCDVIDHTAWVDDFDESDDKVSSYFQLPTRYNPNNGTVGGYFDHDQLELLGITSVVQSKAMSMNDSKDFDFNAIADYLEENLA
jgi:hypothetical protein